MHKPIEYNEFILELPHSAIAGITNGNKHGKPVLAIHGWLDNAASFIPLLPYMQDLNFVAIDLPGHGYSSHIPSGSYFHFIDYIPDIIKILEYLNWDSCYLLGHSLGAGISTVVAGTIPERIKGMVLLDGIGAVTIPAHTLPTQLRISISEYLKSGASKTRVFSTKQDAINARLKASPMQPASVELLIERGLKNTEHGLTWRTDPRLLFTPLVLPTEEQLMAFINDVTAQTCLIRSDAGFPFDAQVMQQRIAGIKNINVQNVAGGHHVHMDNPERVGDTIKSFFAVT